MLFELQLGRHEEELVNAVIPWNLWQRESLSFQIKLKERDVSLQIPRR